MDRPDSPPRVSVVADPRLRAYDFGPHHPFQSSSRWLAVRLAEEEGLFDPPPRGAGRALRSAPVATRAELLRFHQASYLERVEEAGDDGRPGLLDRGDTPAFPGCYEAAARVAGATLLALSELSEGASRRAFQPAGGLHHAHPGRASGFCIFNDVAIAVATALGPLRWPRVAYVDVDAHHGDGVMYGFYEDGRVLDIDLHQDGGTLFPGTGEPEETGRADGAGLKVNLPLPPGSGDAVFAGLFRRVVVPLVREYRPSVIVLQSGVDGHAGDALAQLAYTVHSYRLAVDALAAVADEVCEGRLLVTGGGGYDAGNVALVLGRVPWWMAGVEPPTTPGLPARWCDEFRETTGRAAPPPVEPAAPERSDAPRIVDRLTERLAAALGKRFPAV